MTRERYGPGTQVRSSWQPVVVGALAVLALALRLPGLASRSLWLDEAWRANIVLAPSWPAFWTEVLGGGWPGSVTAPLPPIFALLLRGLALVVGHSEGGLRLLPLAASVLAVHSPLWWHGGGLDPWPGSLPRSASSVIQRRSLTDRS